VTTAIQKLDLDQQQVVTGEHLLQLRAAEQQAADQLGLPDYKFDSNEAMLRAIKGESR
jgi:hypothetical protein